MFFSMLLLKIESNPWCLKLADVGVEHFSAKKQRSRGSK